MGMGNFVGVLKEPHISKKKRLLGSWIEKKEECRRHKWQKKKFVFHLHTVLLTPWLKEWPAVVDVKLAHTLSCIYLKSPIWRSEVVLFFVWFFFVCFFHACHSTRCMCTSLWVMRTLTWFRFTRAVVSLDIFGHQKRLLTQHCHYSACFCWEMHYSVNFHPSLTCRDAVW